MRSIHPIHPQIPPCSVCGSRISFIVQYVRNMTVLFSYSLKHCEHDRVHCKTGTGTKFTLNKF